MSEAEHNIQELQLENERLKQQLHLASEREKFLARAGSEQDDFFARQMAQFLAVTTDSVAFLDREYRFTYLNQHARDLISPDRDLVGVSLFEAFPEAGSSPFAEHYASSMERGVSTNFEAYYPQPLDTWFSIQSHPIESGIVLFFRNITQEKADHAALRQKTEEAERQHAELETIYRTAPIGLALFDLDDYHYLRLNDRQAAFFGMKPEEIVGQTLLQLAPIEGLRELFDKVAQGEPVINFPLEGTLITDPSSYRYWTVSYFPVYGADGKIQAITAASLEITHQKKAELALLQSEKLAVVGRLASSIAHEINNPLESVTNLLYLAQSSTEFDEIRHFLSMAEIELRRVSAITSQTLRFHKQASNPQEMKVTDLIDSVLSVYQGRILNAHVDIERRSSSQRKVRCFEGEIRQVLSNLVSNALDAMASNANARGGRLIISDHEGTQWRTGKRGVFITIADTGGGIPPKVLEKLFNPFFTTKGVTGTGLGLWVSQEIVGRHAGDLRVRSCIHADRSGTVFTIFLPFEAATRP